MLPRRIPKPAKRASRWRSQAHTGYVRGFACAMCGSTTNVVAAHVRLRSGTGGSQKPDDWLTAPLCDGPFSNIGGQLGCHNVQHTIGEETFWERYQQKHGQSVWQLLGELQDASPKRHEITKVQRERGDSLTSARAAG